jgi:hypothetical protein
MACRCILPSSFLSSLQPPRSRHSHSIVAGHDTGKRHDVPGAPFPSSRQPQPQRTNATSASPWLIPSPHPSRRLHVNAPLWRHVRLSVLSGYGATWLCGYGSPTSTPRLRALPDRDRIPWHPDASARHVATRRPRFVGPQPAATRPSAIPTTGCVRGV